MLNILIFDEPLTLKLRLEGELDASSVHEFHGAVAAAGRMRGSRRLVVDVGDMTLQGPEAESAILKSRHNGIAFVAATGPFAELIQQQERKECSAKCGLVKRIAFALSCACQSSPRPMCIKLYRRLHSQP